MNNDTYNPSDPEFLASCALDEPLTCEQQAALDRALAESDDLRGEVERLHGVSDLVARWAMVSPEIDWETHAALISANVASDPDHPDYLRTVDRLVHAWGSRRVEFDEEAFAASVIDRITPATMRPRLLSRGIFRLAAPLAAAAVIALAVSLQFFPVAAPEMVSVVSIGPAIGIREGTPIPIDNRRAVVSFARVETPEAHGPTARPSFRFVSIGVSSPLEVADDASPL